MSPKRFKASIKAAGGVVRRPDGSGEYLLAHRPRYDDWTLPKGKLNRREGYLEAALREVREETGVRALSTATVGSIGYKTDQGNRKVVRWWLMDDVEEGAFKQNSEVDEIEWLGLDKALKRLDYDAERSVLERADALVDDPTRSTIYLIRHGRAGDKTKYRDKDRKRPLDDKGRKQALRLAAELDGHPITRIVASPAQRTVQTVRPLSFSIRLPIQTDKRLDVNAGAYQVLSLISDLSGEAAALSTHGEAIASTMAALSGEGVPLDGPSEWRKGSAWVLEATHGKVISGRYVEQ